MSSSSIGMNAAKFFLTRLEWSTIAADIVHGHADGVRKDTPSRLDEGARGFFVDWLGKLRTCEHRLHGFFRFIVNLRGWHARTNARQHRLVEFENELQELTLLRAVLAADRPDTADVADSTRPSAASSRGLRAGR
jgi:hypothetical protein